MLGMIVSILMAGSCKLPVNPQKVAFEKPFVIGYEHEVTTGKELRVAFDSVSDSRCPEGVQCIRWGELIVGLKLTDVESEEAVSVNFCVAGECKYWDAMPDDSPLYQSGDTVAVGNNNYSIIINDYTPKPAKQENLLIDYTLTLIVKK